MRKLVTGGAGFIGSAAIREIIYGKDYSALNVDKLTYAWNLDSLSGIESNPRYEFVKADICDANSVSEIFRSYEPKKGKALDMRARERYAFGIFRMFV